MVKHQFLSSVSGITGIYFLTKNKIVVACGWRNSRELTQMKHKGKWEVPGLVFILIVEVVAHQI